MSDRKPKVAKEQTEESFSNDNNSNLRIVDRFKFNDRGGETVSVVFSDHQSFEEEYNNQRISKMKIKEFIKENERREIEKVEVKTNEGLNLLGDSVDLTEFENLTFKVTYGDKCEVQMGISINQKMKESLTKVDKDEMLPERNESGKGGFADSRKKKVDEEGEKYGSGALGPIRTDNNILKNPYGGRSRKKINRVDHIGRTEKGKQVIHMEYPKHKRGSEHVETLYNNYCSHYFAIPEKTECYETIEKYLKEEEKEVIECLKKHKSMKSELDFLVSGYGLQAIGEKNDGEEEDDKHEKKSFLLRKKVAVIKLSLDCESEKRLLSTSIDFQSDVKLLPNADIWDENDEYLRYRYFRMFDKWGTEVISEMEIGGLKYVQVLVEKRVENHRSKYNLLCQTAKNLLTNLFHGIIPGGGFGMEFGQKIQNDRYLSEYLGYSDGGNERDQSGYMSIENLKKFPAVVMIKKIPLCSFFGKKEYIGQKALYSFNEFRRKNVEGSLEDEKKKEKENGTSRRNIENRKGGGIVFAVKKLGRGEDGFGILWENSNPHEYYLGNVVKGKRSGWGEVHKKDGSVTQRNFSYMNRNIEEEEEEEEEGEEQQDFLNALSKIR